MKTVVAWDYETNRIKAGDLAPKAICGSMAYRDQSGKIAPFLAVNASPEDMAFLRDTVTSEQYDKVAHNAAYDLAVLCSNNPELFPRVFEMVSCGEVHCTIVREKLLSLTDHGSLKYMEVQGSAQMIEYKLVGMERFYLGRDRSDEKDDPAAWRTNYGLLDGVPLDQWPDRAKQYAIDDSVAALEIYEIQEQRRAEVWEKTGHDPFATEALRVSVDFALYLISCWGMEVDPEEKAKVEEELQRLLDPSQLPLLYQYGIVRRAEPPRPYANNVRDKDGNLKMTKGKPESVNKTKLKAYMVNFAAQNPQVKLLRTPKSDKFPKGDVSTKADWFEDYAALDPVLTQYQARQKLQKMVTTEMPRLCTKDEKGNSTGVTSLIVHPCFNVLVETGRTSSFATDTYPSLNGQNVDPRARPCMKPREGYWFFSSDYNQMELGTAGQRCLDVLGYSILADTINQGIDVHEYTGGQLAYHLSPEFQQYVNSQTATADPRAIWEVFHSLKKTSPDFFKHFRTFAKPTNLGYPGGLGPDTFIAYAKGTFGVTVSLDMAKRLRELWMLTYPEFPAYFQWLKDCCIDHRNGPKRVVDEDGNEKWVDVYAYTTRLGLHRAAATFCAAANGSALQSPSAEGATIALFNVQRACYDPSMGSILCNNDNGPAVRLVNFIHDELLGEVRADEFATARVKEVERIMVEAMRQVTPDVTPRVKSCLMERWYKQAEPRYDQFGNLIPWTPEN